MPSIFQNSGGLTDGERRAGALCQPLRGRFSQELFTHQVRHSPLLAPPSSPPSKQGARAPRAATTVPASSDCIGASAEGISPQHAMISRTALLLAVVKLASANQYDVLFPKYLAPANCTEGCAKWADVAGDGVTNMTQAQVTNLFANGTIPADAGSSCAMPGSAPVHGEGRRLLGAEEDSFLWDAAGGPSAETTSVPYCLCKGGQGAASGHCTPPMGVPEQINLQYAAADTLVAAFVTYETEKSTAPPVASFGAKGDGSPKQLTGITHWCKCSRAPFASSFQSSKQRLRRRRRRPQLLHALHQVRRAQAGHQVHLQAQVASWRLV